jgi:hypothetical protein
MLLPDWRASGRLSFDSGLPGALAGPGSPPPFPPGDLKGPALWFLAWFLTERLDGHARLQLSLQSGRVVLGHSADSLLTALYLQMAQALDGGHAFEQCKACRKFIRLRPGENRADRVTCSPACRVRLHRQRVGLAVELKGQGKTPRQIAAELGSDVESVKKWIAKAKGE